MSTEIALHDGFADDGDDDRARVIQGTLIKFADGVWKTNEGPIADDLRLVAMATGRVLQKWIGRKAVETIVEAPGQALPDVDDLNAGIPRDQWELDLAGQPRPPWQLQRLTYLIDPNTAGKFTFATASIGGRIAIRDLMDRVRTMRRIKGSDVCPLVGFGTAAFKTKYGVKQRPEFRIVEWCVFGTGKPTAITDQTGITKVEAPTLAEEMNDELPPWLTAPAKVASKS